MKDDLNITEIANHHFKLAVDNDASLALLISEMTRYTDLASPGKYDKNRLAAALESLYTELPDQIGTIHQTLVFSALLQAIVNFIDWQDLAEHFIRIEEEHDAATNQPEERDDVGLSDFERNSGIY